MKSHRDVIIEKAVTNAELPPEFAQLLIQTVPWLDGTGEVSQELAPELFADEATAFAISSTKIQDFIGRYNTLVQATENPEAIRQTEAYVAIGHALEPYGKADAFGEGDYWLVSDSFSSITPTIVVLDNFRLPSAAVSKLQEIINQYGDIFSELRINTDCGAEVITLRIY